MRSVGPMVKALASKSVFEPYDSEMP
jgi:hypothetical protein